MKSLQPFRWFGSKARMADEIMSYAPKGKAIWCELFAGSGILTLLKDPHPQEHLNDMDGDVVNVFRILRDPKKAPVLIEAISLTPYAEMEFRAAVDDKASDSEIERGRRFLIQCWQGQGGVSRHKTGFRFSTSANTNPARTWSNLPERFERIAARLRSVTIWSRPAIDLFARFAPNPAALVFADPPYPAHSISSKPRYRVDMDDAEHLAMADAFRTAKCSVLLTMNPGTIYEEVLADWRRIELRVRGSNNVVKTELLLTNCRVSELGPLFAKVKR